MGSVQDSQLVVNVLKMEIEQPKQLPRGLVLANHGIQFTSWAFTNKIRSAGLIIPSFGTIRDAYDNVRWSHFGQRCRSNC